MNLKNLAFSVLIFGMVPSLFGAEVIRVGSKNFPESYILGDVVVRVLEEHTEASIEKKFGMGGTGLVFQALKNGEIDVYPEYTGTIAEAILKNPKLDDWAKLSRALNKEGLVISRPLGFNNTYAIGVRPELAKELNLKSISDLAGHPKLKGGFSYEFMKRSDGYPALAKKYGFSFKEVREMEHSLAYEAIKSKKIDFMDVYSTDAKSEKLNLVLLSDDKEFFPRYDAVFLARAKFVKKYPDAWQALQDLSGQFNDGLMRYLNGLVEIEGKSFAEAASIFLDSSQWQQLAEREKKALEINIPEPKEFAKVHVETFKQKMIRLTKEHLVLVIVSLGAAILVGVPWGFLAFRLKWLGQFSLVLIGVLQTIPALAMLCFLIPFFGIGTIPSLVALFLYALLPIVRGTHAGFTGLDPKMVDTGRALGLSGWQRLIHIQVPLASMHILSGIKTSAVISVGTATLAALIGAGGYGTLIVTGLALNDLQLIFLGAGPAALLAIFVHWFFEFLDWFLIPQGLQN